MVKKAIRQIINSYIKELKKKKIKVAKVILFGSHASGRAHEYSDIDVAVVSPDFGKDRYREGAKLFEIACTIDPRIEPVPISLISFKNDTWIPIIYEIRKNGIELKAA
ncbi:MAG: nucleotidyltransferase domain-containing protein [Deltaproteobacteria bacterium]|nr:nucleotidyltransferase domain-containing protein [Deltaproteobacteria bacterium]